MLWGLRWCICGQVTESEEVDIRISIQIQGVSMIHTCKNVKCLELSKEREELYALILKVEKLEIPAE